MKISLGIPTYNRASVLLETIRNIQNQNPPADEILVVDQSDWYPQGAKAELLALAQRGVIRYVRQEEPSLPKARNRILADAEGDIVIFIDDDVNLSPGFIAAHLANYSDKDVSAVCGSITERDIAARPPVERTWAKTLDYKYFDPGWMERVEDFGSLKGGNHSVRRGYVLSLGGYDEGYIGVALREETDLAFRILRVKGTIRFDPAAHLYHLREPAGGCRVSAWGDLTAAQCVLRFAMKHRKQLGRYFWSECWHAYRLGVLNKNNFGHPLRIIRRTVWLLYFVMRLAGTATKHASIN